MASGEVSGAIEQHLVDNWTGSLLKLENTATAVDGTPLPPAEPEIFVAVAFEGRRYGQVSIGDSPQAENRWDEIGLLYLDVLVPINQGSQAGRTVAKQLADLFRGTVLLDGSLEFLDAVIGAGARSDEYNGNYFLIPVDVEWRRLDG